MLQSRKPDEPGGVDPVAVGVLRGNQAVRGHEDRAVEPLELLPLEGPGAAVVPDQVVVLPKNGIGVRREHLAVSVNIHTRPARLFKEVGEVLEVVAGDKDTRPRARRGPDGRDRRRPVGGGVRGIEEGKDLHPDLAARENMADHIPDGELLQRGGEGLLHESRDLLVLVAEDGGVVVVGAEPFEPVDQEVTKRLQVGVHGLPRGDDLLRLCRDRRRACRRPGAGRGFRAPGGREGVADAGRLIDHIPEAGRIEVHVGQGRKEASRNELPGIRVPAARLHRRKVPRREPLEGVDQDILESGSLLILAADAAYGAAETLCRLFTLVAEHSSHSILSF
ncbi:MAG: hypothetical protein BWX50_01016 [Euryarchaeota archaeon ADurb.Bin009]|nr:MAG: hypothetical protein BWX50_01016 [Euryarchaeota archaeon ADurb.Bin009]